MRTYWLFVAGLLVNLSLLLINDFFPGTLDALGLPMWLILAATAGLVLAILIRDPGEREKHFPFIFLASVVGYPVLLIAFLTLLGGESNYGISLTSSALWISAAVTVWHVFASNREAEKQEANEFEQ